MNQPFRHKWGADVYKRLFQPSAPQEFAPLGWPALSGNLEGVLQTRHRPHVD